MVAGDGETYDVAIIGGGIAGAGLAATLTAADGRLRVLLLEQEDQPGYHASGRSAALFTEVYGNATVRRLTVASKPFFETVQERGFSPSPAFSARGALFVAREDQRDAIEAEFEIASKLSPRVRLVDKQEACTLSPALSPDYIAAACLEPDAQDIDVDVMLQGFLKQARKNGVTIQTGAAATDLTELGDGWAINVGEETTHARIVVNAAGAWASDIAAMAGAQAIQITPKRRTAFLFEPEPGRPLAPNLAAAPMTIDIDESFYFKPDAGLILGSPADETPTTAHDAFPEEMDIAVGADRIQTATSFKIERIRRSWAGLRSFAEDKTPVVGFDEKAPGFFWLAGQGGYGIQTSPAMSGLAAALILGMPMEEELQRLEFDPNWVAPSRFS